MITELAKNVFWVGVADWGLRHFHGHELSTHRGSTYNSYLILDEKVTLIDTVWTPFQDEFIQNIRKIIDPSKIDIIVTNHSEVDHSGALPAILRHCPSATVVVSRKGRESVEGHYHQPNWNFHVVQTGDRLKIGKHELVFIEAPMLHWPDSMFTCLTGPNILFPNDAFGQHYSTEFRFNDQVNEEELYEEALKYYANIITPFSALVTRKIQELLAMNLPIDMIAPSHGVIWRKNPLQIVEKYQQWAAQTPEKRALILYDTMWNATRRMAEAISDGLVEAAVPHKMLHMAVTDRNDLLVEIFKARALVIGSPTLNRGILPTIAPILEDLEGLAFKNKIGAAFGSFGWNAAAVAVIEKRFAACKIPVIAPGVSAKWQPRPEDLQACRQLGQKVAEAVKAG